MNNNRLNVFIQDLKDTTTVLQQLEVCIKNVKSCLNETDAIVKMVEDLDITSASSLLNIINDKVLNMQDDIDNLNEEIIKINRQIGTNNYISQGISTLTFDIDDTQQDVNFNVLFLSEEVATMTTTDNQSFIEVLGNMTLDKGQFGYDNDNNKTWVVSRKYDDTIEIINTYSGDIRTLDFTNCTITNNEKLTLIDITRRD